MGIDVRLETSDGEPIETILDFDDLFQRLLAAWSDGGSCCLRFIDPYGDTHFNRLQVPVFAAELEAALARETDPAVKTRAQSILDLARRCEDELHTHLRFYGA